MYSCASLQQLLKNFKQQNQINWSIAKFCQEGKGLLFHCWKSTLYIYVVSYQEYLHNIYMRCLHSEHSIVQGNLSMYINELLHLSYALCILVG